VAKEVSICGDMVNNAGYLQFLIGCGIRKLSMNPIYLAENQKIIGEIDVAKAEALSLRCCRWVTSAVSKMNYFRFIRLAHISCNVVFLIFLIITTFQLVINKYLLSETNIVKKI